MSALEELQSDHEALRQSLVNLREALTLSETADIVQARLHSLLGSLRAHVQREKDVFLAHTARLQGVWRAESHHDHAEPQVVLRDLTVLFSAWRISPTETLFIHLCRLLEELREWLDEEEREIFPMLKGVEESDDVPLKACLTKDVKTIAPSASLDEAANLMERYAVHRLPVVEDGRLVGVPSLADIARATDERMGFRDWREAEQKVTEIVEAIAAMR